MNIKRIASMTALAAALATSGVAFADHDRRYDDDRQDDRYRDGSRRRSNQLDVIAEASLRGRRGVAEFRFTSGMRRDGLQLVTDASRLRITSIELEYSDGRIAELRGRDLRITLENGELFTFQRGRPAGLRVVRVGYAMSRLERGAQLSLVQIHDGDGYTREGDRDFVFEGRRDRW